MKQWLQNSNTGELIYMEVKEMSKIEDKMKLWTPKNGEWVILKDVENKNAFTVVKYNENYKGIEVEPYLNDFPKYF